MEHSETGITVCVSHVTNGVQLAPTEVLMDVQPVKKEVVHSTRAVILGNSVQAVLQLESIETLTPIPVILAIRPV